jgi:hypothetical protein
MSGPAQRDVVGASGIAFVVGAVASRLAYRLRWASRLAWARAGLMTPFHMMALMCPATTPRTWTGHTAALAEAAAALTAA